MLHVLVPAPFIIIRLSSQVEDEVDEIVMCIVQNKIDLIEEATMTP